LRVRLGSGCEAAARLGHTQSIHRVQGSENFWLFEND
jgi:hypothetical protein